MKKPVRNVLYIITIVICVFAIFLGVYAQFFKKEVDNDIGSDFFENNETGNTISYAEIKENFRDLFTNNFEESGYDDSRINKIDQTKPIIYTAIELQEESDGKYDINISIPLINIQGSIYNGNSASKAYLYRK